MGKSKLVTEKAECTFEKAEAAIWQSKNLTGTDKVFYQTLKSFRNRMSKRCFPSIRMICDRAGMSRRSAYKSREKLEDLGIIKYAIERGRKHRNHYRFILEDGNLQEISRALDNLSENKIEQNGASLNRVNERQLNRANERQLIEQNSATNHTKRTIRKTTTQDEGVVLNSFEGKERERKDPLKEKEITKEDRDYIDMTVEKGTKDGSILKPSAYRFALEKKALTGDLDTSDIEQPKEKDSWDVANEHVNDLTDVGSYPEWQTEKVNTTIKGEEKIKEKGIRDKAVKITKAETFPTPITGHDFTRSIVAQNKERDPEWKMSGFMLAQVPIMEKLLESHPADQIEAVLRYHHENRIDVECLETPALFAVEYERLLERYMDKGAS